VRYKISILTNRQLNATLLLLAKIPLITRYYKFYAKFVPIIIDSKGKLVVNFADFYAPASLFIGRWQHWNQNKKTPVQQQLQNLLRLRLEWL
jgi:hypothetical protein